jgi:formylglycine-generating enzyme required for sulfatase activity
VWPLLRHRPDPTLRSFLVERAGLLGVGAHVLVRRLEKEKDVSARRALIVALGEYNARELPAELRAPLVKELFGWYRDDPDAGVHGAIDWLLRHGKEGPARRPLDWGQRKELERIDAGLAKASRKRERPGKGTGNWFVNGWGQTYSIVRGPVTFRMGSLPWEPGRYRDERSHVRTIERSFALATKPVTVAQWQEFLKERPDLRYNYSKRYSPEPGGPIVSVTWYEAAAYCNWLSKKEGLPRKEWCYPEEIGPGMRPYPDYLKRKGYRLPTEAEWECACRAGTVTERYYGWGEALLPRHAHYLENSKEGGQDRSWPVGQKRPNDLGLFDMNGNVWQWVQDRNVSYPPGGRVEDVEDTNYVSDNMSRIIRGGSFLFHAAVVRSANRVENRPAVHVFNVGFRPCRTYD